jgi:hypothetical protein
MITDEVRVSKIIPIATNAIIQQFVKELQDRLDEVSVKFPLDETNTIIETIFNRYKNSKLTTIFDNAILKFNKANNGDESGAIAIIHKRNDFSAEPIVLIMRKV